MSGDKTTAQKQATGTLSQRLSSDFTIRKLSLNIQSFIQYVPQFNFIQYYIVVCHMPWNLQLTGETQFLAS